MNPRRGTHLPYPSGGRRAQGNALLQVIIAAAQVRGPPPMPMPVPMGFPHPVLQLVQQQHAQEPGDQNCPNCPVGHRIICMCIVMCTSV